MVRETHHKMEKYTIDAKNRVPGRIATEVAVLLMGKNRTDFARNSIPDVKVEVINADSMTLAVKKLKDKQYHNYSGYPGGLRSLSQQQVVNTKGAGEVLKRAIYGMLPKNKLRPRMMINLKIKN